MVTFKMLHCTFDVCSGNRFQII
uniref:Uncharacterized protein n=1 Tax=Anguilla anguilla TaxID=7936 RepID=A0A0E9VUW0_ANGAN